MNCQQVQEKLERYIDGELEKSEYALIKEHVANCPSCATKLANLQAVDATGKMNIFPEPESEYWNHMNQSVMERIREIDKQPAKVGLWIEKIKSILWPGQVRFRLVSLATSAALVFFFLHFTFFRNGQFEMPAESIQNNVVKHKEIVAERVQQSVPAMETPQQKNDEISVESEEIEDKSEKTVPSNQTSIKKKKAIQLPKAPKASGNRVSMLQKAPEPKQINVQKDEMAIDEIQGSMAAKSENLKVLDSKQKQRSQESFDAGIAQPIALEKRQSERKKSAIKSQFINLNIFESDFEKAKLGVEQTSEFAEKMLIWEKYLEKTPPLVYKKKAIREQLQLYFNLATGLNDKETLEQAIKFYQTKLKMFNNEKNYIELKEQFELLKENLKKVEKK